MSELPGRAAFVGCLHTCFQIVDDPVAGFELELAEVTDLKIFPRQESFSLIFQAPASRYLPQQIYRLVHNRLGEMELFLVPVGHQGNSFLYEVIFNHLLPTA